MSSRFTSVLLLAGLLSIPFMATGCESSHSETTKQNLLGGTTHQETTTYKNPDGTVSVDQQKTVTH